jgi:DNA-binding MarR family transcriptional regulator
MEELHQILKQFVETYSRQSMRHFIAFIKERGLSMSQMATMQMLHRHGACGVSDIADYLEVTPAASSQLLNKLVNEGLIERQEDKEDRRVKKIALTPEGDRIIRESIQARQYWFDPLIASLSAEEQDLTKTALTMLVEKAAVITEIEKLPE